MSKKQVCLDCETGGLDPNSVSLLTVGLVVHEMRTGKVFDKLYLEVKEPDGVYRTTSVALKVNKLDLVKHDSKALEPEEAVGQIVDFLKKNFDKELPVTVGGQNTPFDIGFMKVLFSKAGADYDKFFHYSYQDTMPILRFLSSLDIIPPQACRLTGAAKHFNIPLGKGAHNALQDALATVALFAKLSEFFDSSSETGEEEEELVEEKPKKKRGRPSKKDVENNDKKVKKEKKVEPELDEEDEWNLDEENEEEDTTPEELSEDEEETDDNDEEEKEEDNDENVDDWDDWPDLEEDQLPTVKTAGL